MSSAQQVFRDVKVIPGETSITATMELNADAEIFRGHFPAQPVLPGACMLQLIKEVLETALHIPLQLRKASSLKFLKVIHPGNGCRLQLRITYAANNEDYTVNAQLNAEDIVCFRFKGLFTAVGGR